ncbi:MAG TPA: class I SAM-dependent methyltransferase [Microlunatus sp.]
MNAVDDGLTAKLTMRARQAGFVQSCSLAVGRLLSALAASKPEGSFLELGTGAGLGTAHIRNGMTSGASLVSVERDSALSRIAVQEVADPRIAYVVADGAEWLATQRAAAGHYDLVFADTWPGKFDHLDQALALVAPGGLYVIDDLSPQATWPTGHQARVDALTARLEAMDGWRTFRTDDATGVMICTRFPGL